MERIFMKYQAGSSVILGDHFSHTFNIVVVGWLVSCVWLFCSPLDYSLPGSSVYGIFQDLPDPGIKPASPTLAGGFFTTEPPGKPSYITWNSDTTEQLSTQNNPIPFILKLNYIKQFLIRDTKNIFRTKGVI